MIEGPFTDGNDETNAFILRGYIIIHASLQTLLLVHYTFKKLILLLHKYSYIIFGVQKEFLKQMFFKLK